MKVIVFGATGMVGQGALRECLLDERVGAVLTVGRSPVGRSPVGNSAVGNSALGSGAAGTTHTKLRDLVTSDLTDLSDHLSEFAGYDACLFCLGVSSAGMSAADYTRITYDLTLSVANTLAEITPDMTFCYVSGAGTDSSEQGRIRWARVKGRTENALLALPFRAYMFRPGFIQPLHGIVSKTPLYRAVYRLTGPLLPLLSRAFPKIVTTTEDLGKAMLTVAATGWPTHILETTDICAAATG
ncbi:MAG TPA: epimerase [Pseudonocardiaceae bacterium]|jgi:uncharacterized protein YbjT (DUF2867 family)|nr:epimerase [Pseudonocardiaceae bacterium]